MTKITKTFDARGLGCPIVMLELNKAIHGLSIGDVLEFISSEAFSQQDIPSWSRRTGHKLLNMAETDGVFHFIIRKGERIRKFQGSSGFSRFQT